MEYEQEFYNAYLDLSEYNVLYDMIKAEFKLGERSSDEKLGYNLLLYVANLLLNGGKIAAPRGNEWFSKFKGTMHTETFAVRAQNMLKGKGFITIKEGYRAKGFNAGFATQLTATKVFFSTFEAIKIEQSKLDITKIPDITLRNKDKEYLEIKLVKLESRFETFDEDIPYIPEETPVAKDIEETKTTLWTLPFYYNPEEQTTRERLRHSGIEEITLPKGWIALQGKFEETFRGVFILNHTYFNKIKLGFFNSEIDIKNKGMIRNVYLTRMFQEDLQNLGRFTQKGGLSYQNISREDRAYLTINNIETIEVDYKSLHPNLLYTLAGVKNPHNDIYSSVVQKLIEKEDKIVRDALKKFTLVALNAISERSYISAMNYNYYKEVRLLKTYKKTAKDVITAFKEVCPEIASYLNSGVSSKLMKYDSDLMDEILFRLKDENILGLPLHDSIICQKGTEEKVATIMKDVYFEKTGFHIGVDNK